MFIAGPGSHFPVRREGKLGLRVCLYKIEHFCETSGEAAGVTIDGGGKERAQRVVPLQVKVRGLGGDVSGGDGGTAD